MQKKIFEEIFMKWGGETCPGETSGLDTLVLQGLGRADPGLRPGARDVCPQGQLRMNIAGPQDSETKSFTGSTK